MTDSTEKDRFFEETRFYWFVIWAMLIGGFIGIIGGLAFLISLLI